MATSRLFSGTWQWSKTKMVVAEKKREGLMSLHSCCSSTRASRRSRNFTGTPSCRESSSPLL